MTRLPTDVPSMAISQHCLEITPCGSDFPIYKKLLNVPDPPRTSKRVENNLDSLFSMFLSQLLIQNDNNLSLITTNKTSI